MDREEYIGSFKNPKWQKKRLHILSRDNFTCQFCGEEEQSLHVHHFYYEKDCKPWEYPDSAMVTLCERCHRLEHLCEGDSDYHYNTLKDFFKANRISMVSFSIIMSNLVNLICEQFNDKTLKEILTDSIFYTRDEELFEKLFSKK